MIQNEALEQYVEQHTTAEDEVLAELNRQTHLQMTQTSMLSGHLQGRVLQWLSQILRPRTVLEIGTYTGYSAICLARGLRSGGHLITIDNNDERTAFCRHYFEKAGLSHCIDMRIGNALDVIPAIDAPIDLVFIDADKENYLNYYNAVVRKVPSGGHIIADNVLWYGKVVDEKFEDDAETQGIKIFNDFVHTDPQVENILLPLRDGLMVLKKI